MSSLRDAGSYARRCGERSLGYLRSPVEICHCEDGPATEDGLAAGRDEVMVRPVDVLGARYPVVRRLLGDESFTAVAAQFVRDLDVVSISPWFGDEFSRFLRRVGDSASIEYLADIAELERARIRADRAPKGVPVGSCRLSSVLPRRFETILVDFHPSVSLIASRFPIVTIWEANKLDDDYALQRWGAEAALVARCFRDVAVRRLPAEEFAFLRVLSSGATLATAIDAATTNDPNCDACAILDALIQSHIVIGLRAAT